MLKSFNSDEYVLWKTHSLKPHIIDANNSKTTSLQNTTILAGDLENMYTSLDHDSIIKAYDWLIKQTTDTKRAKGVNIPMFKHSGEPNLGSGTHNSESHVFLSFAQIREIILFDLNNTYFSVGDTILQQHTGISMGSPLSPALAIMLCCFYEQSFRTAHAQNPLLKSLHAARYMDDVLALVHHTPTEKPAAQSLLNDLSTCYHKNMTMDTEDDTTDFKFLESTVTHPSPTREISLKYFSKNTPNIQANGKQLFFQYQDYSSYSIDKQKRGTIISTFCRINRSTMDRNDLINAYTDAIDQFFILKYPRQLLHKSLLSMVHNPKHDMDNTIWQKLQAYYSPYQNSPPCTPSYPTS